MQLKSFQAETAARVRAGESFIVWAPSGAGKTLAGWLAAKEALEMSALKTCVFLAPRVEIYRQHLETLKALAQSSEVADIVKIGGCAGSVAGNSPEKRAKTWKECRLVVALGETFQNDLQNRLISPENCSLVIYDEVDLLTESSYAYSVVDRYLREGSLKHGIKPNPRLIRIGLTAETEPVFDLIRRMQLDRRPTMYEVKPQDTKTKEFHFFFVQMEKLQVKICRLLAKEADHLWKEILSGDFGVLVKNDRKMPSVAEIPKVLVPMAEEKGLKSATARLRALWLTISLQREIISGSYSAAEALLEKKIRTYYVGLVFKFYSRQGGGADLRNDLRSLAKEQNPKDKMTLEILKFAQEKRYPALVFCGEKLLAEQLERLANENNIKSGCLTSKTTPKTRSRLIRALNAGELPVIFATSAVERGIHWEALRCVIFRQLPVTFQAHNQLVGRVGRLEGRLDHVYYLVAVADKENPWEFGEMTIYQKINYPSNLPTILPPTLENLNKLGGKKERQRRERKKKAAQEAAKDQLNLF